MIKPEDWEMWEQVILSGQVPAYELEMILESNPELKIWLEVRAEERGG